MGFVLYILNFYFFVYFRCGYVIEVQEIIFNKRIFIIKNKGEGLDFVCKISFKF